MKRKIVTALLAVLVLLTGSVQNVLAVDNVPARRAIINSQTASVIEVAAELDIMLSPELEKRLNPKFGPNSSTETSADEQSQKKPAASRGNNETTDVQKVIRIAVSLRGTPYKWNGERPGGFDCSGFTRYVYKTGAGINLPHSSAEQARYGTAVAKTDLIPGDLVFFNTSGSGVSHVGIFIGGNNFINATTSKGVMVSDMNDGYWGKRYLSARRVEN